MSCELNSDLQDVDDVLTNQDLVGAYTFDEMSLNYAVGRDAKSSKLILKLDGTLEIQDFTTSVFTHQSYDVLSYKQTTAEGTWKIGDYKNQKVVRLDINFDRKFEQIKNQTIWEIYTKENILVLYNLFGDIDACSAARLLKIE